MTASTRRAFLAGTLAATAAPVLARADAALGAAAVTPMATREVVRRGRAIAAAPRGGRLLVAHDQRRTVAVLLPRRGRSRVVDVGGQPVDVAIAPDGRLAAVSTAFWDAPGLVLLDLHRASVLGRVEVGPAPGALAFSADGRRLLVAGGEQEGQVHIVDPRRRTVLAHAPVGTVPRGVAIAPQPGSAWVVLAGEDRVVRVALGSGRITRTVRTPRLPDRVAVSPDGHRLLVCHGGRDAEHVTEIDLRSGRLTRHAAGRRPSAVAWTAAGHRLVTLAGSGEVVRLSAAGHRTHRKVGGSPRGLAVAGGRAWTVDALTGAVASVRA